MSTVICNTFGNALYNSTTSSAPVVLALSLGAVGAALFWKCCYTGEQNTAPSLNDRVGVKKPSEDSTNPPQATSSTTSSSTTSSSTTSSSRSIRTPKTPRQLRGEVFQVLKRVVSSIPTGLLLEDRSGKLKAWVSQHSSETPAHLKDAMNEALTNIFIQLDGVLKEVPCNVEKCLSHLEALIQGLDLYRESLEDNDYHRSNDRIRASWDLTKTLVEHLGEIAEALKDSTNLPKNELLLWTRNDSPSKSTPPRPEVIRRHVRAAWDNMLFLRNYSHPDVITHLLGIDSEFKAAVEELNGGESVSADTFWKVLENALSDLDNNVVDCSSTSIEHVNKLVECLSRFHLVVNTSLKGLKEACNEGVKQGDPEAWSRNNCETDQQGTFRKFARDDLRRAVEHIRDVLALIPSSSANSN